jgi:phage shock protein A
MMQQPRAESFLDRMLRIFRQKLVARANRLDDPAEAIDVVMAQQLEAINRTRADLALVATGEKRLGMLLEELEERARAHVNTAVVARKSGDEPAAQTSMRRAIVAERLAKEAQAHIVDVSAQRVAVEGLLEEMRAQYERLRLRRESIRAMASAARAVANGNESMTPVSTEGADREILLARAHETLADLRARALALSELRSSGALDAIGTSEFDNNQRISDAEVHERLDALE